jgi:excisionase family DNA binding protein
MKLERAMLTLAEAAAFLGVSPNTLRRMEARGVLIPYRTAGGHRRYSLAMLESYLESRRGRQASNVKPEMS